MVKVRYHDLLNFGAGKNPCFFSQQSEFQVVVINPAFVQIDGEDICPHLPVRQVEEEDLAHAALSDQFRRHAMNAVGRSDYKYLAVVFRYSGEHSVLNCFFV